ncbi:ring-1,2-phenylacetyl-CoA epoxidase subunit PaaE [Mesonia hippocampi]|uniref:Ring-1,2-phenylacetyl-CoA epoxidase subunit PaaE n=1 Tax=Mesonia hippocampi TaxID=1628250 RepID=A0A840EQU0_9FLAO|nr:ring-1,2-phenylacetyl-CoA epoxidase subunit PaaE [Mesonia hippocampi]
MKNFHSLKIKEVVRETSDAVSLVLDIPTELKTVFNFDAGQYITIKAQHEGEEIRRSYSLCSSPNSGVFQIAIKQIENGVFSTFANTNLKAGDVLEVFPPEGKFIVESSASNSPKNYAAFAAGSGITPVMSILKSVLETDKESKFVLVYGNKSPAETIFLNELNALKETYKDRFFIVHTYSQARAEDALFGRIEKSTVNYMLKNKFKELVFDAFYLCGPEQMIESVRATLKENGVAEDKVNFELFNSTEEGSVEANLEGKTQITVIVDEEEFNFTMDKKENILDAVLDKDIDAPYSCQGGICSSCIAKLTEGKAEMAKNQILTDSEIAEGLILTCQAHPITPTIKVDYDDV